MEEKYIDMIEPTPIFNSKRCNIIAKILEYSLTYSIYFITIFSFYLYDFFIAFLTLGLSFIVIGIIKSKLKILSIPIKQLEYLYSDEEIARWYLSKNLCFR